MSDLVSRLRECADWMRRYEPGTDDDEALMREAADALERQQWVSVDERLPAIDEFVFWRWLGENGLWYSFDALDKDDAPQNWKGATHWKPVNDDLPLPEPPQD